ncbi:MAG TPA: N-acetylmuramoyl-L-alanine amidase [Bacteroidia bacterium]
MQKFKLFVLASILFANGLSSQVLRNPYQSFFNQAYINNPTIPKGVLEAVAYTQSRFNHIQVTEHGSCIGLPQAYGVMGLIADGKSYFRNNLVLVSQLSGSSVDDIINSPETNIKAYAKAYATLLQQTNNTGGKQTFASKHTWVLTQLSELPMDSNVINNFALNSHLYSVYSFLNKPEYQAAYSFPKHPINMEEIFGKENLKVLSSEKVIINKEEKNISTPQGNNYKVNNLNSVMSPDYPPAAWIASPNHYTGRSQAISAVVIHDTEGSYASTISWFQNTSSSVSAHYVVRSSDGAITQMVLESNAAWHVGSENEYTIGIEHEGFEGQTGWYTTAMYNASAALVRDICASGYGINPLRTYNGPSCNGSTSACLQGTCIKIKGHQMYPNQTHIDPGPNWDWYTYYDLINNAPTINTVTAASGTIYDSGGPTGNYSNDERILTLIQPAGATNVTLSFTQFSLENIYDYLFIYDGATVTSPLLGRYTGTSLPGTITSSTGSLLLDFRSDCSTTDIGYAADYTSNASTATDHIPPITSSVINGTWQTQNFTTTFVDADNVGGSGLEKSYYQAIDFDGTNWGANNTHGFFADDFTAAISPLWTPKTGTWSISGSALYQSDTTLTNTNIYAPLTQTLSNRYLYYFTAKIGSNGTNRRAGFHFFCDNPDSSNRNNSYFVWFRVDQSQLQIYKVVNNVFGTPVYTSTVTVNSNQYYNYIVIYDRTTGLMRVYQNNVLIGSWTDPSPYSSGGYVSFRSGNADMWVDQFRVYRSRAASVNVSVGAGNANDLRYQNTNPTTPAAHINSICSDSATNLSAFESNVVNIDWTPPAAIDSVRDGTGTDINVTSSKTSLSANWSGSSDINSGIAKYWYCIGTTAGDSNVVAWGDTMLSTSTTKTGLHLTQGQWYYFTVKAQDGAGLFSIKTSSNGQKVDTTSGTIGIQQVTGNNNQVTIYPNPANTIINVKLKMKDGIQTAEYKMMDMLGNTVKQSIIYNLEFIVDIADLAPGIYLLNLSINGEQKTLKLIKEGN